MNLKKSETPFCPRTGMPLAGAHYWQHEWTKPWGAASQIGTGMPLAGAHYWQHEWTKPWGAASQIGTGMPFIGANYWQHEWMKPSGVAQQSDPMVWGLPWWHQPWRWSR